MTSCGPQCAVCRQKNTFCLDRRRWTALVVNEAQIIELLMEMNSSILYRDGERERERLII